MSSADRFAGGGLLNNVGATMTLKSCTVAGNRTVDADNDGAGIHTGGTLTLDDCTLADNIATENGGGINIAGGTVTLRHNTTVTRNHADPTPGSGGGIFVAVGTVALESGAA